MMLKDMGGILWAPLVKRVPVTLTLSWIFWRNEYKGFTAQKGT